MGARIACATLGYPKREFDKMITTSKNVRDNGMYTTENAVIYPNPHISKDDYSIQLGKADTAQTLVKEGGSTHNTTLRNKECALLHDMNVSNVLYANQLFKGNSVNLDKSGYPLSKDPAPIGAPNIPHIKKGVKGSQPGSVKILLEKNQGTSGKKLRRIWWALYVTDVADNTDNLTCICRTTDSRKLINPNAERGKDLYYYVTAQNTAGESDLSNLCMFMLN